MVHNNHHLPIRKLVKIKKSPIQIIFKYFVMFLDASSHLYKRVCPSVGRSVGPSVRPSVGNAFFLRLQKWRFFFMYVIREAQEHYRNVELHLYRKVCLLVRPSVHVKSRKKGRKDASISWPNLFWRLWTIRNDKQREFGQLIDASFRPFFQLLIWTAGRTNRHTFL